MPGTPDSPDTVSYLRTLPEAECFELLAVAIVGRVGFVSPAGLQIIPMSYRLGADHQLFMKTAPGSALAQLAEIDAPIAFEVDYHANDFQTAWSVLMNGTISRLDAAATAAYEELRRPPVPWAGSASSADGIRAWSAPHSPRLRGGRHTVDECHTAGSSENRFGGEVDVADRLVRPRISTRRVRRDAVPRSPGRFDR